MLSLKESIEVYKSVGHRNPYLFEWLSKIYEKTTLSCADPTYLEVLTVTKTKLTIFDVLIDDVADNVNMRNRELLEKLMNIPWEGTTESCNDPYYNAAKKILLDCINTIEKFPRFAEFKNVFYFDLKQVMNSMEYSSLINTQKELNNLLENEVYGHHGVMVILHEMLDIMCSPGFDIRELGKTRELLYLIQKNMRMGNMMNTYPREVVENDISSQIVTYALGEGIINNFSEQNTVEILNSLQQLEKPFDEQVKKSFRKMRKYSNKITSFDVLRLVNASEEIYKLFKLRKKYWEEK